MLYSLHSNDLIVCKYTLVLQSDIQKSKIKMCRTIILPIVLCVCEAWCLILREEHRLRVFESGVAIECIFSLKRDEVTQEGILHNKELYDL
jgi:hypothetical protein